MAAFLAALSLLILPASAVAASSQPVHELTLPPKPTQLSLCSNARPIPCIRHAAWRYRVSFPLLLRKAKCESQLDPHAQNPSDASGLFQFMPSTWLTTPYASHSIWSARYSALAAAWMHAHGRGGEWVCP